MLIRYPYCARNHPGELGCAAGWVPRSVSMYRPKSYGKCGRFPRLSHKLPLFAGI